jgi:hypothetical protein
MSTADGEHADLAAAAQQFRAARDTSLLLARGRYEPPFPRPLPVLAYERKKTLLVRRARPPREQMADAADAAADAGGEES